LEASDPFHLTSFALALLLAFRLDASYSRYMEARSLWGDVVCDARNLMRQVRYTHGAQVQHTDNLTSPQDSTAWPLCTFTNKSHSHLYKIRGSPLSFIHFAMEVTMHFRCGQLAMLAGLQAEGLTAATSSACLASTACSWTNTSACLNHTSSLSRCQCIHASACSCLL